VTICSFERSYNFGSIDHGHVQLSKLGRMIDQCWRAIPLHFPFVRLGIYRVMPNHIHGIIDIIKRGRPGPHAHADSVLNAANEVRRDVACNDSTPACARRDVACNVPTSEHYNRFSQISPKPSSLSTIIRSFKSAVSKLAHEQSPGGKRRELWQGRFHDHVIRSDVERFFIERYIELNPLVWALDPENPSHSVLSRAELRKELARLGYFDPSSLDLLIDLEIENRESKTRTKEE
jgi:putative transposase